MEQVEPRNSKHGLLTAKVAREISPYWEARGYQVLYDHDPASDKVGKVVSSFGDLPYDRSTQLSHVDIAIVEKTHEKVFALIEIEETTDKPKTILGDVLGVLMGEHISFGKEHPFSVNEQTILVVFVKSKVSHEERNKYLREKVEKVKPELGTKNSAVRKVFIETFSDEKKLSALLSTLLDRALKGEL